MIDYGVIGVGEIAGAIVAGLCAGDAPRILLSPRNAERAAALAARYPSVSVAADNQAVVDGAAVVVLAIRPQDRAVLGGLRFRAEQPVISLLAGVSHAELAPLVAPARDVTRAIPLPSVARRAGVTPIHPAGGAARTLFGRLGDVVEVDDIAAYEAMAATTATLAAHFRYVETIASWLAGQGIPAGDAESYVAAMFAGLAYPGKAEEYATPGGINEQFARLLDEGGTFTLVGDSLDAILARLTT